jgi:hypothetical protein
MSAITFCILRIQVAIHFRNHPAQKSLSLIGFRSSQFGALHLCARHNPVFGKPVSGWESFRQVPDPFGFVRSVFCYSFLYPENRESIHWNPLRA